MQQVAIMNYTTGTIDIYPYPEDYDLDVEDWFYENGIPFDEDSCFWMHSHTEIPVNIHD